MGEGQPFQGGLRQPRAGSPPHLFGVLFVGSAEIDMLHVPFKGGGPLITDLIGGHIPAAIGYRFHRTPQEREVTSAGDQRCQAFRIHSRCCDLCRTRVQRSTGGPLVRILGPGQNTCDDYYPA